VLTMSEFPIRATARRWRSMPICRSRRTSAGRKWWSWNRPKARWRCSTAWVGRS
jgi:hypothetical protein